MPATYLVAIVALGLTVVPLLLVVVNGFRTNADINNNAAGLPSPWVAGNYTAILKSAAFWQLIGNSALISVVATALVLVLGTMAALVDGASRFRFFVQILLPLAKPALVTVGLLAFVTNWNQYFLPLLVLQTQSHYTLPLGTYMFQSSYSQNVAGIFAYSAMAMLPALGAFVFAERYIVAGATGAVKG